MPLRALALAAALLASSAAPAASPAAAGAALRPPVVELGLTSPLEDLVDMESFRRELAERLVWTVRGEDRVNRMANVVLRFTAVRIDRGRVTASYQSDVHPVPEGLSRIASSVGQKSFMAFPDVCLSPDDPPASVRSLSGEAYLDSEGLEQAIATAARTREIGRSFGLERPLTIERGRHAVLVLAAVSEDPGLRVRPLILVLERQ